MAYVQDDHCGDRLAVPDIVSDRSHVPREAPMHRVDLHKELRGFESDGADVKSRAIGAEIPEFDVNAIAVNINKRVAAASDVTAADSEQSARMRRRLTQVIVERGTVQGIDVTPANAGITKNEVEPHPLLRLDQPIRQALTIHPDINVVLLVARPEF
jgi:hypothetical protein